MRIRTTRTTVALVAGSALLASAALAWDETQSYGVANFGGAGECGSKGQTHSVHTKTSKAFDDAFDDLQASGKWDTSHMRDNKSSRGSYWEDPGKQASGDDLRVDYGIDDADVIYIHTHGGHSLSGTPRSWLSMGNSGYDCSVSTSADMFFDSDLDIAVIKACQSGDFDVWQAGGYRQQLTDSSSQFRMWNAFHGNSSCGNFVKRYVDRYATNSTYDGVGENWIDEAYDKDWGADNDDCPTSIVLGSSGANRDAMFEWGGWRDRKNTGSRTGSSIYYVGGCEPSGGNKLPN